MLLVILDSSAQRFVGKRLKSPENWVIDATAKPGHSLVANTQRHQSRLFQIKNELRFRSFRVFVDQATIDADHFQRALFEVVCFLRVQCQDLPRDLAVRHYKSADRPSAQPSHRFEPMSAIRGPKATVRCDHRDDWIEE